MNRIPTEWLLGCDPWTSYRTRLDLLDGFPGDPAVIADRHAMVRHPKIREMIAKLKGWPGPVVSSHKNGNAFFHLLPWLAELGIDKNDEPMDLVIKRILELASEEGPFGVTMNIPVHYGGTGTDVSTWALCDAPRTVYGLALMGLKDHPALLQARDYLMGLVRENGYPCVVSKELGKFRGPGRKDDPCPYATLIMLELMSVYDELKESPAARQSAETLLDLWNNSQTRHPYMFFMGTDFRKLKAPPFWFDILHVAGVLSAFPFSRDDRRFLAMVDVIASKAGPDGRFTPESVWKPWTGWDFGQKKEPSAWLTYLVWKILKTVNG